MASGEGAFLFLSTPSTSQGESFFHKYDGAGVVMLIQIFCLAVAFENKFLIFLIKYQKNLLIMCLYILFIKNIS